MGFKKRLTIFDRPTPLLDKVDEIRDQRQADGCAVNGPCSLKKRTPLRR